MYANDYFTERNYEDNNIFYLNNLSKENLNPRSNTQNYFYNDNVNDLNEDENNLYYQDNNLNNDNNLYLTNPNSNPNQYNKDVVFFKKRINKLQNKIGKLNRFRNEINEAISYNANNKNNNEYLNKTQNGYDNYDNSYIKENKQNLKMNKSFDIFRTTYNNYDFIFDSGNVENYEDENDLDVNNNNDNYMDDEGKEQFDNENINDNDNMNLIYDEKFKDNSFIGFYDNVFTNKNLEQEDDEQNNIEENNIQENINYDLNKKYDYKNIQLYEQNYQFNIPKTKMNNIYDESKNNKDYNNNNNKNNIQIVSNELVILTNANKENLENKNNIINNNINIEIKKEENKNLKSNDLDYKNKKNKELDEEQQKELQKYDKIIAQAKELNSQFILEQNKKNENKEAISNDNDEKIKNNKTNNENTKNKDKNKEIDKKEANIVQKKINNLDKQIKSKNLKERMIKQKGKNVSFEGDKIYIKYEQFDYILKTNVFNNKNEKINFITHDLKKYIQKLKKNEYIEPAIINCPEIDYLKIKNDTINLIKKEKIVQNQNPRINNRINKSVKNTKTKAPINKKIEIKNNKKNEKNEIPKNNNIKEIKNIKTIKQEKNIKIIPHIPHSNLNKEKNMKKNKTDKFLNKNKKDEKDKEKNDIKNLEIFNNPIFKEGQKAINNLKKFFEENDLDDDNIGS